MGRAMEWRALSTSSSPRRPASGSLTTLSQNNGNHQGADMDYKGFFRERLDPTAARSAVGRVARALRIPRAREARSRLTRRVAVELSADSLLLAAEARRVLLQELALRPHKLSGVVLSHLLLQRIVRRCRQRHAGVYREQLGRWATSRC